MNVSLIRQRFAAAMERGMSVADATAYANSLFGPLRTPGKIAAPSKPVETQNADPDPVQGDSGTNLDNPRGEPVEIPADWETMQWMKQEKLAAEIVGATVPLATAEGQTRAEKARAIISAEIAERNSREG